MQTTHRHIVLMKHMHIYRIPVMKRTQHYGFSVFERSMGGIRVELVYCIHLHTVREGDKV